MLGVGANSLGGLHVAVHVKSSGIGESTLIREPAAAQIGDETC